MTTDKNTLKSWFLKGKKPLEAHFAAWIDSYWHKAEQIPTSSIAGLEATLNSKAETSETQTIGQAIGNILNGSTVVPNADKTGYAARLGTPDDSYTKAQLDAIIGRHVKSVAHDSESNTLAFTLENDETTEITLPQNTAAGKCEIMTSDRPGFHLVDTLGNVGMAYDDAGLDVAAVSQHMAKLIADDPNLQLAEINHIVTYGQSLGEGESALPVITTTPKYVNLLMFNQGVNSLLNTTPEAEKYQSLQPHAEAQWGTKGESPAAGCAEQLCLSANLNAYKKILSSNASSEASKIDQLGKGSVPYQRILTDVQNAHRMATEAEKTYKLVALTWTQGEADLTDGTPKGTYKNLLKKLRQDLIGDLQTLTGQDYGRLPFIMYQMTSTGTGDENRDIALAMYELGIEEPFFHLATPIYMLQFQDTTESWNLAASSSKLLGHRYGQALAQTLANPGHKTIHPLSHRIDGNDLYVKFHVPQGKLAFHTPDNTASLGAILNRGFSIGTPNDNDIAAAVEIVGHDQIKTSCTASPSGKTLKYGQRLKNDNRGQFAGELHDTSNNTVIIDGQEHKLWNWCPIFQYQL